MRPSSGGGFRNLPRHSSGRGCARSRPSLFNTPAAEHSQPPSPVRLGANVCWPRGLFGPLGSPLRPLARPPCSACGPPAVRPLRFAWSGLPGASWGPARAVALVGLLRRGRPARQGARPRPSCVGAGARATRGTAVGASRPFFVGYRLEPRCAAWSCFPFALPVLVFARPGPAPNARQLRTLFVSRRGREGSNCRARPSGAAPSRGVRSDPRPPSPPAVAPTRRAVFFIVLGKNPLPLS